VVERTLRSGFSVRHAGHVVVIGDVNAGAQVIAGGSVLVWGRMRGMVHAGADGNEKAVVCALDLSPTQLRIAGLIATTPQRKGKITSRNGAHR
jgi:septum site-determining protein MinC